MAEKWAVEGAYLVEEVRLQVVAPQEEGGYNIRGHENKFNTSQCTLLLIISSTKEK